MSRTIRLIGSVSTGILVLVATAGAANADTASVAVGPNQAFAGLVNGDLANAKVDVNCPGPLRVNQTGHPTSGQSLGVESPPPSTASTGYTGTRGRRIIAGFVTSTTSAVSTVTFTQYGTQAIPTTWLLPCSGSGTVVFSPEPTSHSARSSRVSVIYSPTCSNPCPVDSQSRAATFPRTVTGSDGAITGELGFEGGPAPGGFHATAGIVSLKGPHLAETVNVPSSGKFAAQVPPGRYTLTGCGGTKDDQCGASQDVSVRSGATKYVQVVWAYTP